MSTFITEISINSLLWAQVVGTYIGQTALDPMANLMHVPTFDIRMPLEGSKPYTNLQIPIGIRIPPTRQDFWHPGNAPCALTWDA